MVYKRPEKNKEESATLSALKVEGDGVLYFCLERDSYGSGYCKTNKVFSVLILLRVQYNNNYNMY